MDELAGAPDVWVQLMRWRWLWGVIVALAIAYLWWWNVEGGRERALPLIDVPSVEAQRFPPTLAARTEVPSPEPPETARVVTKGWVEVHLVDALGEPRGGVSVVLVPPFDGEPLDRAWASELTRARLPTTEDESLDTEMTEATFGARVPTLEDRKFSVALRRAVTDELGVARFDDVPEGWGYRYGINTDFGVRVDPPHEQRGADTVLGAGNELMLDARLTAPLGLSGEFFVAADQGAIWEAQLFAGSVVRGRVALLGQADWAKVVLYALDHRDPDGDGLVNCERTEVLAELTPESSSGWDGSFEFHDVPTGGWLRVRCAYRLAGVRDAQHFHFATATFLAERPTTDLGFVPTLAGRDPHAATVVGQAVFRDTVAELHPLDVFVDPPQTALVKVLDEWGAEDVGKGVADVLRMDLLTPFVLHGLSGDHVRLDLRPDLDWRHYDTQPGVAVRPPERFRVDRLPADIELAFEVVREAKVSLVFHYPSQDPFWGKAFLRHHPSGRVIEIPLPKPDLEVAEKLTVERTLDVGEWTLLSHSNSPFDPDRTANWVASRTFSIPTSDPVDVSFETGRTLSVRAFREGMAMRNDSVSVTAVEWRDRAGFVWTYDSPTDATGLAHFVGLPTRGQLVSHLDEAQLFSADVGHVEITEVDD